jgi:hypothetical protein
MVCIAKRTVRAVLDAEGQDARQYNGSDPQLWNCIEDMSVKNVSLMIVLVLLKKLRYRMRTTLEY